MALTTAHAIITLGDGADSRLDFLAESRAFRIAAHFASICRFAGITRESLRVIVGDKAGSRVTSGGPAPFSSPGTRDPGAGRWVVMAIRDSSRSSAKILPAP